MYEIPMIRLFKNQFSGLGKQPDGDLFLIFPITFNGQFFPERIGLRFKLRCLLYRTKFNFNGLKIFPVAVLICLA